jgi:hypothetical protein
LYSSYYIFFIKSRAATRILFCNLPFVLLGGDVGCLPMLLLENSLLRLLFLQYTAVVAEDDGDSRLSHAVFTHPSIFTGLVTQSVGCDFRVSKRLSQLVGCDCDANLKFIIR